MTKQLTLATAILWASTTMATNEANENAATRTSEAIQTYRQTLVIDGQSENTQPPHLAPVYDGRKWALSTRWDDSNPNALNIRQKMLDNGIRGTFYLNSREPEEQQASLASKLTGQGECSVGGHSVSHPHLPKLPANEVFYELVANRIALECLTDRPVNSLAFPYGGYQDKDRPEVLEGVTAAFLRTGYHHCVYAGFVTQNPFLPENLVSTGLQVVPGDRQVDAAKFWAQIERVRNSEPQSRQTSDCIFLGVHPWQVGEELDRLGEVMKKLRTWDDFWHCTQTEYAAFTKQRRNTKVERPAPGSFVITRPCAFELGSDIPLTLEFDGNSVRSATVDGVPCSVRQTDGKTFVNVPHSAGQGAPTRIDQTVEGVAKKFPGLKASLTFDPKTGNLSYTLENETGSTLSRALLTVSAPPAFDPGILRWSREEITRREKWSVAGKVSQARTGTYWSDGKHYVAAQLDFVLNGERGRLFTTCTVSQD
ncbi:MAG: polysaccharide deacetylase family protein [Planctomycetaceae bacterium]|nr:polysaccharide deacetylase family protein [Planctomycetaceae bacterium]